MIVNEFLERQNTKPRPNFSLDNVALLNSDQEGIAGNQTREDKAQQERAREIVLEFPMTQSQVEKIVGVLKTRL